jgi:hypothetical protein
VRRGSSGKTWKELALTGEKAGISLDAETDVVPLKDGKACDRRWKGRASRL